MQEPIKFDTVLDTGAEQLGATYATALLGAAKASGVVDEVLAQLGSLVDETLAEHPALAAAFASPRVNVDEKQRIIDRLFSDQLNPVLVRFLKVTALRGRLGYLAAIRRATEEQHDAFMGRVVADVRSAVELTDDLRQAIRERLSQTFSKEVRLRESVDASVIGGVVIRVGDTVFDSSVAGRLEAMSRQASRGFAKKLLDHFEMFASAS